MRISGDGKITWENASASNKYLLEMRVAGDSYPRFKIRADGQVELGVGSGVTDIKLYRKGSQILEINSAIQVDDNALIVIRSSGSAWGVAAKVSGDSTVRCGIQGDGAIWWGSGSASADCKLYRRAANILNTPDRLEVGTLGVGNSAAATTPGNVVKKIEVFDDAGNSLGFLAVYDSIT